MNSYYDLRNTKRPLDTFTKQVADKFSKKIFSRSEIIKIAQEQGFEFDLMENS